MQTRTDASLLVAVAAAVIFGASAIVIAYLWLGEVPFRPIRNRWGGRPGGGGPGEQPQKLARVIFENL